MKQASRLPPLFTFNENDVSHRPPTLPPSTRAKDFPASVDFQIPWPATTMKTSPDAGSTATPAVAPGQAVFWPLSASF
jgi:hypothetical protein